MNNQRILPMYPIFTKDPNYSLWSPSELLNETNLRSWWGEDKPVYGFVKSKGKTYCFLGNAQDFASCGVLKAEQISLSVTAFSTDYEFRLGKESLKVRFVSPLPPDDLQLLSMPVCYMEYELSDPDAELSVFLNRRAAYNAFLTDAEAETWHGAVALKGCEAAFLGLKRQLPLSSTGDTIGADWGYWYLTGERAEAADVKDLCAYLAGDCKNFACKEKEIYIGSLNRGISGAVALAYDDLYAIDYFGEARKGYYLQEHTIFEAIETALAKREKINKQLNAFDEKLKKSAAPFGKDYITILYASLRQSVAAHKLVTDGEGNVLFLSKECNSNGCIGTVDVSYPSVPLYLLYNPELVKGMMRPILKFAKMPVWQYDFAPHDVGTYPVCCGQVYGFSHEKNKFLGNLIAKDKNEHTHYPYYLLPAGYALYDHEFQMPVEECGNMLVMFYACYQKDGDLTFFLAHKDLCAKWVEYLVKYGLKPENQLCTDDFAGHLKNNLNLAIKATVGIACYAELLKAANEQTAAQKYRRKAEEFAAEIVAFANGFSHMPITWDTDGETFSLKYNFAFDKILKLGLFPQDLLEREVECYLQKAEKFGTPLDNRETYTKSDWLTWAAALTDDNAKRAQMLGYLNTFLKESPDRVPFGDWYQTTTGEHLHFRARSVQGGCFILLL